MEFNRRNNEENSQPCLSFAQQSVLQDIKPDGVNRGKKVPVFISI